MQWLFGHTYLKLFLSASSNTVVFEAPTSVSIDNTSLNPSILQMLKKVNDHIQNFSVGLILRDLYCFKIQSLVKWFMTIMELLSL
jgi:hypothetical protein